VLIDTLVQHPSSHFRVAWPEGVAVFFSSSGRFPVPPVIRLIETTTSEELFASVEVLQVPPAKKVAYWSMLSQMFPSKYVYPVIAGFIYGRTMRYTGCRYSSFHQSNTVQSSDDQDFMYNQALLDLQAGFTALVPQHFFVNDHTSGKFVQTKKLSGKRRVIVNPSSINSSTQEAELRDPFPTALLLAGVVRSPYFGTNTLLIIFDAKAAYKLVPVAASDLHLLMEYDSMLGFILGLRQQWGHSHAGWSWVDVSVLFASIVQVCCIRLCLPYVDDYAVPIPPKNGKPDWPTAYQLARDIVALSNLLGIEMSKWQLGTRVEYLGYLFDTRSMQLAMVPKWITNLAKYLISVTASQAITVKGLRSLAGRIVRLCSLAY
jgi:hypothetical protein